MKLEIAATDPTIGFTVTDLRRLMATIDATGMTGESVVSARIKMGARVKAIAVEGDTKGGAIGIAASPQIGRQVGKYPPQP